MTQLFERCADSLPAGDRRQGAMSFQAGAVRIVDVDDEGLIAKVNDNGRTACQVSLDWSGAQSGEFRVRCTCLHFAARGTCKHVVAAILAADAQRAAANVPGSGRLSLRAEKSESVSGDNGFVPAFFDDGFTDEFGRFELPGQLREIVSALARAGVSPLHAGLPGSGRRGEPRRPWKKRLAELASDDVEDRFDRPRSTNRPREIWYILDLQASVSQARPRIALWQRPIKKNGKPGALKSLRLSQTEIDALPSAEDRTLIELLAGNEPEPGTYGYNSYYIKYGDFRIAPATFEFLLPRLCASRRFGWLPDMRHPASDVGLLEWDDGPAWTFRLTVARDEDAECWALSGKLEREGEALDLAAPLTILPCGLVVFPDRLARFDAGENLRWVTALRKDGRLLVPLKEGRQFVEMLAQQVPASQITLPGELTWTEERIVPCPVLTISKPQRSWETNLECRLSFRYGEYTAPFGEGARAWYDRKERRVVRRDREAEIAARDRLLAAGAHVYGYGAWHVYSLAPARMTGLVAELMAQGWQVEASGRLIRRPGTFRIDITSNVDWFDLRGECDFDGVAAPLPKLLAAISRGEKFVVLDDGSQGVLPEEWLARYKALAGLGEAQGDVLRFKPVQASLLDALLAAHESERVNIDAAFARLRERLASFAGVQPCDPPESFAGQLRDYQRVGLGWLRFLDEFGFGGCLADDMGLGKTIQVLALLDKRRQGPIADAGGAAGERAHAPSLVVVPRSLVFNWMEEARRFTPQLRVLNYTGLERKGLIERLHEYDLLVTTYGTLRRDIARLCDVEFDCAILDEAQAIKNAASQSAKACRLLKARRRLAMTGTPVENHLRELASLFEFLNPGMLGRHGKFDELFCSASPVRDENGKPAGKQQPAGNVELLGRALRPFLLRRTKQQVLSELPEKTEQTLYCELGSAERELYDELREHYRQSLMHRVETVGLARSKIQVLEALLRLRQASCHPGLLDKKRIDDGSAKLETLLEQLAEVADEGHKTLVFSQFTSLLAIVRRALDKQGVVYEYLDGKTRDRQARVQRFQTDPNCRLFLISLKAGGQGLNLTAADYVFILDPWWNPAVEAQAVDRAHRIGQQRHVFAYRLIARDTVEEKILQLQDRKRGLAEAIVSADNGLMTNLTAADLALLLS